MAPRTLLLVVLQLALLTITPTASAQGNRGGAGQQQNLLALGRQQYDNLHFEEAIQTLSAAIIRRGNTPRDEIQIYELLALAYLSLNRNDEAEGAYRLVLARDPEHRPPADESPRFIEFFNNVRQHWEAEGRPGVARAQPTGTGPQPAPAVGTPVTIEHRSPPQQQRNTAVTLSARVADPAHRVAHLVLAYRAGSSGLFRRVETAEANGEYRATIPAGSVRPPLVEYYFEAVDNAGVPVQARGDAYAPLRIAVPEPGGVPWWVIAGGAVVVVGGAIAVIAVVASQGQNQPPVMPAHLTVGVVGQ